MMNLLKRHALKFFHLLPDGIKLYLRSFKKQEAELYELHWLVEKGSMVIDIGANNGAYTFTLSRLVGRKGRVVAVEPILHLAEYLRRACRQLHLPVDVKQLGLSSREGQAELVIPCLPSGELLTGFASLGNRDSENQSFSRKQPVSLKCLDDLVADRGLRVSFIKCDVEGHELEVLKGSIDILKTDRPNMLVEIEQRHIVEPIDTVFRFIESQGYKGYFLDKNGKLNDLNMFDVFSHQQYPPPETPENQYIYNFIFLPSESPDANSLRR